MSRSLLRDAVCLLPSNTLNCHVLDPILNRSVQGIQSVKGVDMHRILEGSSCRAHDRSEERRKSPACSTVQMETSAAFSPRGAQLKPAHHALREPLGPDGCEQLNDLLVVFCERVASVTLDEAETFHSLMHSAGYSVSLIGHKAFFCTNRDFSPMLMGGKIEFGSFWSRTRQRTDPCVTWTN